MVRYLFYTIGDLTYQSPLVQLVSVVCFSAECVMLCCVVGSVHCCYHKSQHHIPPDTSRGENRKSTSVQLNLLDEEDRLTIRKGILRPV